MYKIFSFKMKKKIGENQNELMNAHNRIENVCIGVTGVIQDIRKRNIYIYFESIKKCIYFASE
jgi:hypothetical protein